MITVHKGFDTITLAIQANIPSDLYEALDAERELAEDARNSRRGVGKLSPRPQRDCETGGASGDGPGPGDETHGKGSRCFGSDLARRGVQGSGKCRRR